MLFHSVASSCSHAFKYVSTTNLRFVHHEFTISALVDHLLFARCSLCVHYYSHALVRTSRVHVRTGVMPRSIPSCHDCRLDQQRLSDPLPPLWALPTASRGPPRWPPDLPTGWMPGPHQSLASGRSHACAPRNSHRARRWASGEVGAQGLLGGVASAARAGHEDQAGLGVCPVAPAARHDGLRGQAHTGQTCVTLERKRP